jgi:hypothetical protein
MLEAEISSDWYYMQTQVLKYDTNAWCHLVCRWEVILYDECQEFICHVLVLIPNTYV